MCVNMVQFTEHAHPENLPSAYQMMMLSISRNEKQHVTVRKEGLYNTMLTLFQMIWPKLEVRRKEQ